MTHSLETLDVALRPALISIADYRKAFSVSGAACTRQVQSGRLAVARIGGRAWIKTAPLRAELGLDPVAGNSATGEAALDSLWGRLKVLDKIDCPVLAGLVVVAKADGLRVAGCIADREVAIDLIAVGAADDFDSVQVPIGSGLATRWLDCRGATVRVSIETPADVLGVDAEEQRKAIRRLIGK